MSKQALQKVIDRQNMFAGFREEEEVDINTLSKAQANALYENIDCGLSPENLHCDGEITRTQAIAKYRSYMQAVKELKRLGFPVPKECWEIEG